MLDSLPKVALLAEILDLSLDTYGNEHCLSRTIAAYGLESSNSVLLGSIVIVVCASYYGFLISATKLY